MKISHRGLYALKALIHLAEAYEGGLVTARAIAEKESIPEKFLEGILLALKNARVVSCERGREGGYRLRKPPEEIRIGDVVRLIDGPLAPFGDVVELQHLREDGDAPPGPLRPLPRGAQRRLGHRRPHEPGRPRGARPPGAGGAAAGGRDVTRRVVCSNV